MYTECLEVHVIEVITHHILPDHIVQGNYKYDLAHHQEEKYLSEFVSCECSK